MYSLGLLFLCLLSLSLFLASVRANWIIWELYETIGPSKCYSYEMIESIIFPPSACIPIDGYDFMSATVYNNTVSVSFYSDNTCSDSMYDHYFVCDSPSNGEFYYNAYSVDAFPQQSPYYPKNIPSQVFYTGKGCTGVVASVKWSSLDFYYNNEKCDSTKERRCNSSPLFPDYQVYCDIPSFLMDSTSPPSAPKKEKKGLSSGAIVGIVVSVIVVIAIIGFLVWRHKRGSHGKSSFDG